MYIYYYINYHGNDYYYYYINYHGNDYGKLHVNEIYKSYYPSINYAING